MSSVMTDATWQAEEDARTLARADEIRSDSKRKAAAVKKAKELAQKAAEEAARLNRVTKDKTVKPKRKSQRRKTNKMYYNLGI